MKIRVIIAISILSLVATASLIFFNSESEINYQSLDNVVDDADLQTTPFNFGAHPRILLSQLSAGSLASMHEFLQARYEKYKKQGIQAYDVCKSPGLLAHTSCWLVTGDKKAAEQLLIKLRDFQLKQSEEVGNYGNAWELAIAYDLFARYEGMRNFDRIAIENKIAQALAVYIQILNSDSPSLWHGRTTLSARAWLCAVVLEKLADENRGLINNAGKHFFASVRAASLTEAWPEGYNYWIQERAMDFVLASLAYLNVTSDEIRKKLIIKTLERIGLWHIYGTRPDNRIEGYGDEGSRVDLKDQTRPIIDLIGQVTKDPVFAIYSRYIQSLHGNQSYYTDFRWSFPLFNDPSIEVFSEAITSLERFNGLLPKSDLFGRDTYNQLFIHSDWTPQQTFISFRAGGTFTHHGHYDAGHFTLFKGAPLAINSSVYGKYFGDNRLYYSIRTIAKNSLLILRPGEVVHPNRLFKKNVSDGGQRVIIPTGSAVLSIEDWQKNNAAGKHYEGGKLIHFNNSEEDFVYISADLTDAYNTPSHDEGGSGGKVERVIRELVYLIKEDILLVHDQVTSTDNRYVKKWLLHTVNKPIAEGLNMIRGRPQNGILETRTNKVLVKNQNAFLTVKRILPDNAVIRIVGGKDFQYYVESDGDESILDGENFAGGAVNKPWFDVGQWRIEIQPRQAKLQDEFLIALSPGLTKQRQDEIMAMEVAGDAKGLTTQNSILLFITQNRNRKIEFKLLGSQSNLYLFGLPPNTDIQFSNGLDMVLKSDSTGTLKYSVQNLREYKKDTVSLTW